MMWFDKQDERALFVDKRSESFRPTGVKFADKDIEVKPDIQADFKALPFDDETFPLVVFDPPHIVRTSLLGNVTKYYGALPIDWKSELRQGFAECFRLLKPEGTLIFKWCESEIPVSEILKLTPEKPLFGHRSGKAAKTHWITFTKIRSNWQKDAARTLNALAEHDRAAINDMKNETPRTDPLLQEMRSLAETKHPLCPEARLLLEMAVDAQLGKPMDVNRLLPNNAKPSNASHYAGCPALDGKPVCTCGRNLAPSKPT